jgi:ribose-phosphate pyrophosphokinase
VSEMMLFTGSANPELAQKIVQRLGLRLGGAMVGRFSDGEVNVEIKENVRGKDVFIIQSTCAPTNDNLMELMLMADALRRASANAHYRGGSLLRLCPPGPPRAFIPRAISAKVVADMMAVGVTAC